MPAIVDCKRLSKDYRHKQVLAGISFALEPGRALLVNGANGAGKTTLLAILSGLLHATEGEIMVHGERLDPFQHALRRRIGFSPASESSLFLNTSPRDNLMFWASMQKMPRAGLDTRIEELARKWEFSAMLDRPARELSSGFRRRVALARAFLHEPVLAVLDEPLAFLDPSHQTRTIQILEEWLAREQGALIMSSNVAFEKGPRWSTLNLETN